MNWDVNAIEILTVKEMQYVFWENAKIKKAY
jgi:hypothetical protein